MLAWSMPCGSVLLLGLIGIEGTRVFRKNCSVTTIRFAEKLQFWAYFCFLGTRIGLMLVPWAGWPGRGAFVDDFGQRCGRGGLGSAVRGCLWWRNVGGWMPWTTRRREWSGPGVTPLVALETLRVGAWSGAAGRHKKCLRLLASVREGKSICWAAYWRFASPWSRAFSLAASVGALTLIPPQRQLYCGIMIRTISKEL